MDSHVHIIAAAERSSKGLSNIVRDFKRATAKEILKWVINNRKESRREWLEKVFKSFGSCNNKNDVFQIWIQNNHPVHCIYPAFTLQKLNYIHRNPVKAGIVDDPCDYRYSSARNYAGRNDVVLDVRVFEFGSPAGYVKT